MAHRTWIDKDGNTGEFGVSANPDEDIGHICIYTIDEDDRNFKYCVYCGRVRYRTNDEILGDVGTQIERKLRGV